MSGFSGINQFGNLTLQNGQRLSFNDIKDVDGDGKISEEEFNAFLKENNVDTIELSLVDKNGDGEITEQEYAVLEQKQQMQEAINAMAKDISFDFAGTTLIPEVTAKLKELVANYENNYNGDISKMAEAFNRELPGNYETIKNEVLANDPSTIKNGVINEMVENFGSEGLTDAATKTLSQQLESVANAFVQSYTGSNLEADLTAHLENWLTKTDSEKLADSVSDYQRRLDTLGSTIESGELPKLLYAAQELLTSALENGVTAKLGEQVVTATNINAVLNKYKDGEALKADLQAFIDGLSTVNKKEQIIADEAAKAEAAAEKAFTDIKGSEYAVNPSLIDYSSIPGYANNEKYEVKGRKKRDQVQDKVREQLESLKDQMRAQIEKMLEAKGIPFDKIAQVFDNVFQETLTQVVDGLPTKSKKTGIFGTGRGRCSAAEGIQTTVQNFISAFNTNIATRVDDMNKSNTDMDLVDIDYTVMAKDEDGNVTNPDLMEDLQEGGITTTIKHDKNLTVAEDTAKEMIDKLKPQMLQKAMNMCKANGIEFDNTVFTTMFNNAKSTAVASSSEDHNHKWLGSHGILNPQKAAVTFTTEFKTNFTAWVEAEKAKGANK